uniref:Uncharacterized protein n=1 Tax=Anguilla anguilla TaxID=7936 RepID=A0A0E9RIQ0_ANGAN
MVSFICTQIQVAIKVTVFLFTIIGNRTFSRSRRK